MNNKSLLLYDGAENRDRLSLNRTEVIVAETETGKVVFKGRNKVIISGSDFTARRHFDFSNIPMFIPTYNQILELDGSIPRVDLAPRNEDITKTVLFAVGTDGCGELPSQVWEVNTTKWIAPEHLVPFRYIPEDEDTTELKFRNKYFGRRVVDDSFVGNRMVGYYFKAFEHAPTLNMLYDSSDNIDETVWTDQRQSEAECFVEIKLQITKEECREFFEYRSGLNNARVNTISLLLAWPKEDPNTRITYYQDIRPLTKFNFPNESLIDTSKGLDITYHLYY